MRTSGVVGNLQKPVVVFQPIKTLLLEQQRKRLERFYLNQRLNRFYFNQRLKRFYFNQRKRLEQQNLITQTAF